jgi:hypothetical protein
VGGAGSRWQNVNRLAIGSAGGVSTVNVKNQGVLTVIAALSIEAGSTVDVGASAVSTENGFVNVGEGGATILGAVRLGAGGALGGRGTVLGNVVNDGGRVRPGSSPGILTINGNYVQNAGGTLEIEVGGFAAGTQHDKLVVSPPGTATLNGQLSVPLIDGFAPAAGDEVTFLTATSITGAFTSISATGLPSNIAVRVRSDVEGPLEARRIRFVNPLTEIELNAPAGEDPPPVSWNNIASWKNIVDPEQPRVPDTADIINVSNASESPQTLQVETQDAFVHQLALVNNDQPLTVEVANVNLSAVASATIGENATIELHDGNLVSGQVQVVAGGTLTGNGAVRADELVVGATMGSDVATLSPGLGVGAMDIKGDYTQGVGGELVLEVASGSQFDTITLDGNGAFGGRLTVEVTDDAQVQPGATLQVITATSLDPDAEFELVRTEGSTDTVFVPMFDDRSGDALSVGTPFNATLSLVGKPRGDLDLDGVFNPAADAAALAQAFANPAGYKNLHQGVAGSIMGNVNNDDFFDFDDIKAFRQLAGMSASELARIFQEAGMAPEPASGLLAIMFIVGGRFARPIAKRAPSGA